MYTPHDVTLIICTEAETGVTERRAVYLPTVFLDYSDASSLARGGSQSADAATLYIPHDVQAKDAASGSECTYAGMYVYQAAPDKRSLWTLFTSGQMSGCDCFFVKGRLDIREPMDYATLRKSGAEVYRVTAVRYYDYGKKKSLHHWEVTGQ